MKKRIIALLLTMFLCFVSIPASSESLNSDLQIIYYPDGSYVITELIDDSTESLLLHNRTTVTKSKASTYYANTGTKCFTLTVTGTFTYDGTSATCTSATYSSTIHNNEWSLATGAASHSGNSATATGTFVRKVLGVVVSTKILTVTLSCSPSGEFS
jgi:hypothetical protein